MSLAQHTLPDLHHKLLQQQAAALRQHMAECRAECGRWQLPALLAERAHSLVAPRFVTTVGMVCGLLALGLGWL